MVKKLIAALIAFIAVNTFADAILWMVDETVYDGEFTAARVMVTPTDGGDSYVLATVYYDEETGGYTSQFPAGIAIINDNYNPPTTGESWSLIADKIDPQEAQFYVELGHYKFENNMPAWDDTVAIGMSRSYSWLVENHMLGQGGDFDNVFRAWDGTPFQVVPEPTTWGLILVGCSLLVVSRRKVA